MIRRENKDTIGRQVSTFFLWLGIPVISDIMLLSLGSFVMGLLYFKIAVVIALLTGMLILSNKEGKDKWNLKSLDSNDFYSIFKIVLISLSLTRTPFCSVVIALFYEKLLYAEVGSPYYEYNKDIENSQYYITKLWYYIKQPIAIFSYTYLILIFYSFPLILKLYRIILPAYLDMLIETLMYIGIFHLIYDGAKLVGGSWKSLFYLPTKKQLSLGKEHPYGSYARNFKWMLIAFLIASPTILISALFPGYLFSLIDLAAFSQMEYVIYSLSCVLLNSVQSTVEEIVFTGLFYRYGVLENLCPEDYKDMDSTQQIIYSFLKGAVFAFSHQQITGYTSLISFIPLMGMGCLCSMLAFLNGSIELAIYSHTFHNISCSLCPGFANFWCKSGYEFAECITPFFSESLKYVTVVSLEDEYCNVSNDKHKSRIKTMQELYYSFT